MGRVLKIPCIATAAIPKQSTDEFSREAYEIRSIGKVLLRKVLNGDQLYQTCSYPPDSFWFFSPIDSEDSSALPDMRDLEPD